MMPVYCLDTSALLYAMNERYPPGNFPSLWEKVEGLVAEERLTSPDEVYKEVEKKDDEAFKWCKARSGIFVPLTGDIQLATIEILREFPRLVDTKKQRQQADPFVIAVARVKGAAVLTAETHRANGSKAPRIPDVCDHYGVDCHSFLDLIQIEGWVF